MITIEIIKSFAIQHDIPEFVFTKLVNDSLQDVAKKMYPKRKLYFDVLNDKCYEVIEGKAIEFPIKKIIGRRFILKSKIRLSEILQDYDSIKFKLPETKRKEETIPNNELEFVDDDFSESDNDYSFEDGPFCSACQQAPCMCSDRERTSTVYDF